MATGEGFEYKSGLPSGSSKLMPGSHSPVVSRDGSPDPDRLAALKETGPAKRAASPRLSRQTLEELQSVDQKRQEKGWDPDDPPLSTPWTFWYQRTTQAYSSYGGAVDPKNFSEGLRSIYTVRSIKEFFSVYKHIKTADQLVLRECYHLMRNENRRPMWEDLDNINGGTWTFKAKKEDTLRIWQELLLAAIGEQFADCTAEDDDVVGVSVKGREYESQFQIWNENASCVRSATVMERVRELLPDIEIRDFYTSTKERLTDSSSSRPYQSFSQQSFSNPSRYSRPARPFLYNNPPSTLPPYHYYPSSFSHGPSRPSLS